MKVSQMGLGITRLKNINKQFPAQDILVQSGQLLQFGTGIYAYNNIPLMVKQNLERLIREELNKSGCIEISLPTLQATSLWQESGRYERYTSDGTMMTVGDDYCLAPTAEEAVVAFARNKIKSHKDLPVILYQIGEKYRNELRTRGYLLRGKSFPMMDAYSFTKNEEGLVEAYNVMRNAYLSLFKRLGLEVIPVAADNGAIGGKKSEEFMMLSEIGEDTILYDEKTGQAFNTEIMEKPDYEEYLKNEYGINDISSLKSKKAIELGHIFQLGTKYSETMKNATFINENSEEAPYCMGCYGIGVSRTIATIYEKSILKDRNGKPSGIALPTNIAPYILQIIPKGDISLKVAESQVLYEVLKKYGVQTILDDRNETTIGAKIKDAKVLGTPYLALLGDRTKQGEIEIENSRTGEKVVISQRELAEKLIQFEKARIGNPEISLNDYIDFREKSEQSETSSIIHNEEGR